MLDVAVEVMGEQGVAGLTLGEVARRMGIRPPSLYVYFDGKHALYDALFERGWRLLLETVTEAESRMTGTDLVRDFHEGMAVFVRWAVEHPAYAPLMFWRPVPGFVPSEASMAESAAVLAGFHQEFAEAIDTGQIAPGVPASQARDLAIAMIHGLTAQQVANEPDAPLGSGRYGSLVPAALALFRASWQPRESGVAGMGSLLAHRDRPRSQEGGTETTQET